ncbi:MAG: GatB/YqeY domain-containing protein [Burkholderiaceae bacterium]|nr:MAG: GatB/YqeY domain-containing protein [Burkholderiaceae bacterium]TAM06185.1 MAG: GatB/YqeY domain-containing protein [Pusillimonas sp.]
MSNLLKPQLAEAIKTAMRAKDRTRLNTLRLLHAAIRQIEIDERRDLDDAGVTTVIEKQVKQRRESIIAFEQAGRADSAKQEQDELLILQEFLPRQAAAEEIDAAIQAAIADAAAQGMTGGKAMGKIMGQLKTALAGRADMSAVSAQVKARLA